jgi:hypothetical protein
MMAERSLFQIEGLGETLRIMNKLPKEAKKELKAEVQKMANRYVPYIQKLALSSQDPRVRGLAPSVRAKKDRLPTIIIGGARTKIKVSRPGKPPTAGDVVFGTEFGDYPGSNDWRFPPTAKSYWLFRGLKLRQDALLSEWEAAVTKVARKWAD